jgi:nitric oxide reductase NorD protein
MHGQLFPLSAEQLQEIFDDFLGTQLAITPNSQTPYALALARGSRLEQEWVLAWLKILRRESVELASCFVVHAPRALVVMEVACREDWVREIWQCFDRKGLSEAIALIEAVESYAQAFQQRDRGLSLIRIQGVLGKFLQGLNGRALQLASAEVVYTDTQTLFLPAMLSHFVQNEHNFLLYKAMAVHLWAQTWFGTWRYSLSQRLVSFNHREKAVGLFHTLERLRLDACIARELPGMARDMGLLLTWFNEPKVPAGWESLARQLALPTATIDDSYALLSEIYRWAVPPPVCYQGMLLPDLTEPLVESRRAQDKSALQSGLASLMSNESSAAIENQSSEDISTQPSEISDNITSGDAKSSLEAESAASDSVENLPDFSPTNTSPTVNGFPSSMPPLAINGETVALPAELQSVIASIIQDEGEIPPDYLQLPAGSGGQVQDEAKERKVVAATTPGESIENKRFFYPEWDYQQQRYYDNWCILQEVAVPLDSEQFVTATLARYQGFLKTLRRTFEKLRGGDKVLKKQADGDDIDMDALVMAYAEAQSGLEMSEQIFIKRQKVARDLAVMFMVDMSGSTQGWINQAERESLVLLCEVLETLGDRYAIYGFSGNTRKCCEIYPIKRFTDAYNSLVRQRISGITPQQYTRMGVTIRHLTQLFKAEAASIKLLITLSDGKPDDDDERYRGTYGIEDTRQALLEAKREGIHPFCITIDSQAKTYLPRMYGAVNYIVIEKVSQLPLKISDIYKKLTT